MISYFLRIFFGGVSDVDYDKTHEFVLATGFQSASSFDYFKFLRKRKPEAGWKPVAGVG
jgi:hypothetical protein